MRLRCAGSSPRCNSQRDAARGALARHKFVVARAANSRTLPNTPRDHPRTHDTLPERLAQTNVFQRRTRVAECSQMWALFSAARPRVTRLAPSRSPPEPTLSASPGTTTLGRKCLYRRRRRRRRRPDSSCCLRAAPRRPRWARRRARARAPAPRGARVGGCSCCTSARTSRAVVVFSSCSSLVLSPVVVLVSRGRRARDARATRTSRVVLAAAVQQGRFRAVVVFSSYSSLVPSPVVVLVSRLLFGRRAVRSKGGARVATGDASATRAARVHRGWLITAVVAQGRSRAAVLFSSSVLLSSRPSLRAIGGIATFL